VTTTPPPSPGWYPDPSGAPQSRWWDGTAWTAATQLDTSAPTARSTGPTAALAVGIGALVVLMVLAVLGGVVLLRSGIGSSGEQDAVGTTAGAPAEGYAVPADPVVPGEAAPVTAGPCTYRPTAMPPARPVTPPAAGDVLTSGELTVTLETSAGRIRFLMDAARTPCTASSLRSLAQQGYFDNSPCHRLTTEGISVLQCGDPTATGTGGPGYEYDDEALTGARYPRGTVAMANAGPGTNGSQFFLVYADASLPASYTPLGRITEGLEVIDRVAAGGSHDDNGPGDGRPRTPVQITSMRVTAG
jgi:peptidyl-prolyl cis-trans isomerase B (cyclophilin B)